MNEIFGLSTTTIMIALLGAFAFCLAVALYIALRYKVVFKLGVRNIPRRPAQTVLIVIGLMLSTLIVAAALTTGDTLNHSIRSDVYKYLGQTDQLIVLGGDEGAASAGGMDPAAGAGPEPGTTVPVSLLEDLRAATADEGAIDGYLGVVAEQVPAIVQETEMAEPVVTMTGLEPEGVDAFGGL